jgi:hypothetical protein
VRIAAADRDLGVGSKLGLCGLAAFDLGHVMNSSPISAFTASVTAIATP